MPLRQIPERTVTFRQVFLRTLGLVAARYRPLLIGAASFTLLCAVVVAFTEVRVQKVEDQLASSAGISWSQLNDILNSRLATLSETGAMRIAAEVRTLGWGTVPLLNSGALAGIKDRQEAVIVGYIAGVAPYTLGSFILQTAIMFVAGVFFLLLATAGMQSAYEVSKNIIKMIFPMVGLVIWLLIRSFIWIPFAGIIIAIYLIPRLALAPVLLSSGELGIFQSASESMRRTRGRWFTVFVCLLGAIATWILILWFGFFIVSALSLFSDKLAYLFWLFTLVASIAWEAFLLTMLTASLG